MRTAYERYKTELLTVGSVLASLIIAVFSSRELSESLVSKLPFVILVIGYFVLGARVLALGRERRFLQQRSLSQVQRATSEQNRYRDALDDAKSCYFFLGMSAEEFQREISIQDYFQQRVAERRGPLDVRVLLLHPDSPYFAAKLHDVNRDADLQIKIQRKKDIMRTLVHSFASVPASAGKFEVRFVDAKAIWAMQFYDCASNAAGTPDTMRVMPQLAGRHGKFSHVYELDSGDPDLFASFLGYFEGLWEQALPSKPQSVFPDLYASSGSSVTTLAFDFDGTLVNSAAAKREAFMHALGAGVTADQAACDQAYAEHGAMNRIEQLKRAYADVHTRPATESEATILEEAYTAHLRSKFSEIKLFSGFDDFHTRFRHRYRFIIASSAPREEVVEMCDDFGITDVFVRIYGFPTSKTSALREVLDEFGIEARNLLYVGDRIEDGMVADTVGTRFCQLDPQGTQGASPYKTVGSLGQLASVLYDLDIGIDP